MEIKVDDEKSYVDVAEFFISEGKTPGDSFKTSTYSEIDSPIKDLKAIVLSLDWDISENTMQRFSLEVERLETEWQADKVLTNLLKILHALGKYINNKKARAHPDSMKFLYSTYNSLEKIVLSPQMSQDRRLALAGEEINRFKEFKKQVDTLAARADTIRVPGKAIQGSAETAATVVERLKTVAATLDARVEDRQITAIRADIDILNRAWSDDRTLLAFLRLLTLLATQVKEKKYLVHPEVFEQLRTVAAHLEQAAFSPDLTFREKNDLAAADVKRYQEFEKRAGEPAPVPEPGPEPANVMADLFKAQPSSPVDQQLTDIHLAVLVDNYSEVRAATLMRQTEPAADSATREIVGKKSTVEALPDIEQRLTDFFGEDESTGLPAGSLAEGQVVPYGEGESAEPLPGAGERLNQFFQEDAGGEEVAGHGQGGEVVAYPGGGELDGEASRGSKVRGSLAESTSLADLLNLAGEINSTADASLFELFSDEINLLGEAWSDHPDRILLLRLVKTLAHYLRKQRDQARPGSVELLRSLCNGLESVVLLAESERDESLGIFAGLLNRYLDFFESLGETPLVLEANAHEVSLERLSVQEEAAELYEAGTGEACAPDHNDNQVGALGIREVMPGPDDIGQSGLWQKIIRLFAFKK